MTDAERWLEHWGNALKAVEEYDRIAPATIEIDVETAIALSWAESWADRTLAKLPLDNQESNP